MKLNFYFSLICLITFIACSTQKKVVTDTKPVETKPQIDATKLGGGASGMAILDEQSYVGVYDLKNFQKGIRVSVIKVTEEELSVRPIVIENWDNEGISSDLESICKVPGTENEFFASESGNWQGKFGRIFHIRINPTTFVGTIINSVKLPIINRNDFDMTGDQYEAITSISYSDTEKIIILGERGGSKINPNGIVRWGVYNVEKKTFEMSPAGKEGIQVQVPGNWTDNTKNRDITDFYVDKAGKIWASASDDLGDAGPFYSVIYQLGTIQKDKNNPIQVVSEITNYKEVNGFKIEALSGPAKGIKSTLSFATEDENYGGVWRPILMD